MFKFLGKVCAIRFFSLLNTVIENGEHKREQLQQQQQQQIQFIVRIVRRRRFNRPGGKRKLQFKVDIFTSVTKVQ